jgi:hypothetical protein
MKGLRQAALWAAPLLLLTMSMPLAVRLAPLRLPGRGPGNGDCSGMLALISKTPSFSFGFRNLFADVAWLEAVQTAGNKRMQDADYRLLSCQLNIVADFDPRFDIPYLLGGLVLSESPDYSEDALLLLARGKPQHSRDWRFPFYMGYIQYFSFGETMEAGKSMREAALLPGSPTYLPLLATRMLSEGKDPEAALALLSSIAAQETDPVRRGALERRMREVAVERDLQSLERAVQSYRRVTGAYPRTLRDLVDGGLIRTIPREPNGGVYILEPGGKVRSSKVAQRLRVFQRQ